MQARVWRLNRAREARVRGRARKGRRREGTVEGCIGNDGGGGGDC